MIDADWHVAADQGDFLEQVAAHVAAIAGEAVDARGSCLLALPGGATPRPIFERLVTLELPWQRVTILPTDERQVPPTSDLSNFRLLAESFSLTSAVVLPLSATDQLPRRPDLVWLGMGADGHTASIFAGPDLEAALTSERSVIDVTPDPLPPEAPVARATLTRSAIMSAHHLIVTITGSQKRALLEQALAEGALSKLPIGRVLAGGSVRPQIYWCP